MRVMVKSYIQFCILFTCEHSVIVGVMINSRLQNKHSNGKFGLSLIKNVTLHLITS